MPKKTRQEKIIASLRRQLNVQQTHSVAIKATTKTTAEISPPKKEAGITYQPISPKKYQETAVGYTIDHSHVVTDLKKIFFITILAAVFEGILYFLINLNGFAQIARMGK